VALRPVAISAALLLLAAAPAGAAFSPAFDATLDPAARAVPATLVAAVAPREGDTALRRLTLRLGGGFELAPPAQACPGALELAGFCPADSRVGTIDAAGAALPLHLAGAGERLAGLPGVTGRLVPRPGGPLDVRIEGLPPGPAVVTLDRLLRSPSSCGPAHVDALMTSTAGEGAAVRRELALAGCSRSLRLTRLRVTPSRFAVARSLADVRRGFGTVISWRLTRETTGTRFLIERRAGRRWRRSGSIVGTGLVGENLLRFDGRLRGRGLRPGLYRVRAGRRASRFRVLAR